MLMLPWSSATRSLGETKLLTSEHPTGVLGAVHGVIETLIEPSGCVLRSSPTLATSGATWVPASAPLKVRVVRGDSDVTLLLEEAGLPATACTRGHASVGRAVSGGQGDLPGARALRTASDPLCPSYAPFPEDGPSPRCRSWPNSDRSVAQLLNNSWGWLT